MVNATGTAVMEVPAPEAEQPMPARLEISTPAELQALLDAQGLIITGRAAEHLAAMHAAEDKRAAEEAEAKAFQDALSALTLEVQEAVEDSGIDLKGGVLTVRQGKAEDGTATVLVEYIQQPRRARSGNGNGKGAFGGGSGPKVKGPFRDVTDGKVYANWHEIAVAVNSHTCKPGTKSGSSHCGYWTPKLVALRDSGRFSLPSAVLTAQQDARRVKVYDGLVAAGASQTEAAEKALLVVPDVGA